MVKRAWPATLALALVVATATSASARRAVAASTTHELRVKNRTPFILNLYVSGVRVAWIRPFRTRLIKGLRPGYHDFYATSRYGSANWGPSKLWVPGNWNITAGSGSLAGDTNTAMVSRIYRRNSATLMACDRLAQRRGEAIGGRRVDVEIMVDRQGNGVARVEGAHVSARLRSCYQAIMKRWKYPETGDDYRVAFQHIHARTLRR